MTIGRSSQPHYQLDRVEVTKLFHCHISTHPEVEQGEQKGKANCYRQFNKVFCEIVWKYVIESACILSQEQRSFFDEHKDRTQNSDEQLHQDTVEHVPDKTCQLSKVAPRNLPKQADTNNRDDNHLDKLEVKWSPVSHLLLVRSAQDVNKLLIG